MPAPNTTPARPHRARKRSPRHRCTLPGHWIHVSSRTVHGRYAFVPPQDEGELRSLMWGVVGRAQQRYQVDIAYGVVTSNHFHFILRAERPGAISTFMQYVKAGFARLTHKTYETSGPVWDGRFRSSTILDTEAEVWWLRYCMAHMTNDECSFCSPWLQAWNCKVFVVDVSFPWAPSSGLDRDEGGLDRRQVEIRGQDAPRGERDDLFGWQQPAVDEV